MLVWGAAVGILSSGLISLAAGESARPQQPGQAPFLLETRAPPATPTGGDDSPSRLVLLGRLGQLYASAVTRAVKKRDPLVGLPSTPARVVPPTPDPARRRPRARIEALVRESFYGALQSTIDEVAVLRRLRERTRRLTRVELRIRHGEIQLEGPSLSASEPTLPADEDELRTRIMLAESADLGVTWDTRVGRVHWAISYLPQREHLALNFGTGIAPGVHVGVGCLMAHDRSEARATFTIRLP